MSKNMSRVMCVNNNCSNCKHFDTVNELYIKRRFYGELLLIDDDLVSSILEGYGSRKITQKDIKIANGEVTVTDGLSLLKNCTHGSAFNIHGDRICGINQNDDKDCVWYTESLWRRLRLLLCEMFSIT